MKKLSIGFRLTLWYLAIFALGELLFGLGMWIFLRANIYDMVDDELENQLEDLKSFLSAQKAEASLTLLREEVGKSYSMEHSGDYLAVYGQNGEAVYQSPFLQPHGSVLLPPHQISSPFSATRWIDHRPFRFLYQKLEANGHSYTVEMGIPADDAFATLQQFRSYLLMFAPLLLLVGGGVGYWMSRRALSPVDALVSTAREIRGTNLSTRLKKLETGDELQRLSDTLNEMLDRIEAAFLHVTQFTADASHELRTPVSLIRTEAEVALRRSRGETEYQEALRHILVEAERTTTLIEQLLALARTDAGRETLKMQPVDLRQMLRGILDGWRQLASLRALQFCVSIDDQESFVMGDEPLLRRAIGGLLDNAFKYTSAPGRVVLRLESKSEQVIIAVEDSGFGIAPEEQSKIFERFYRVDKARSRTQGGTGLGLSIAQWIATQHGGSITVESRPDEGSTFLLQLPRIASPEQKLIVNQPYSNPQPLP